MGKRKDPTTLRELVESQPEDALQAVIKATLEAHGCIVLQTNLSRFRIIADLGVPDLLVRRFSWKPCVLLAMEVKTAEGKPTPEQARLVDLHVYPIVRSPEAALLCLSEFEDELGLAKRKRRSA